MTLLPLLLVLSTTASPATVEPAHTLPLWMHNGHPSVAVRLGDNVQPLRFVVDSAAGATVVDSSTATRLGLVDPDSSGTVATGATAASAQLRRTHSTRWTLGTLSFEASAMQTDLSALGANAGMRLDGILGNDITRRWDTRWSIPRQQLQLWTPGTLPAQGACQANSLPGRGPALRGFAFIQMQLGANGSMATAVVDTGAAQTILNRAAASALGLKTDGSDVRVRERNGGTRGLGGTAQATWLTELPALASDDWRHGPLEVRISELPVFKVLGLAGTPALILGADALSGSQVDVFAGAGKVCLAKVD